MADPTLLDLARHGRNLAVRCRCGHTAVLAGAPLGRLFALKRWDDALPRVAPRLRCAECGGRPIDCTPSDAPPTRTVGPADEAAWTALRRRLRD